MKDKQIAAGKIKQRFPRRERHVMRNCGARKLYQRTSFAFGLGFNYIVLYYMLYIKQIYVLFVLILYQLFCFIVSIGECFLDPLKSLENLTKRT